MALISSGTTIFDNGAYNVGGSMVLVSSATASSSASIEFSLGNYKEYLFYLVNIHNNTDATNFFVNFSTDNGSNYNVVKTTTDFIAYHVESGAFNGLSYRTDGDMAQSTSDQQLLTGSGMGSDSDQNLGGYLQLFNPSSSVFVKHFMIRTSAVSDSDLVIDTNIAGYCNTTSPLTNIIFRPNTGTFNGTILMYGIN